MSEIVDKFKYLVEQAEYFQRLKDDEEFLFSELLKIKLENIEQIQAQYKNEEKIKRVRFEACTLLLENGFSKDSYNKMKEDVNKLYETNIFQSWKDYSILYIFFFNPIKETVNQYLDDIGNYLIGQSSLNLKLKTTNFDGAQNFGDVGCWLALYNPKYKSQSEGVQYFINFYHNNTTYGTYEHQSKKDINRKQYNIKNLDENLIQQIVEDIKSQADVILEKINPNGGKMQTE